jgi:hypothetical protein
MLLPDMQIVGSCFLWALFAVSIMMILGTAHFPQKEDALNGET